MGDCDCGKCQGDVTTKIHHRTVPEHQFEQQNDSKSLADSDVEESIESSSTAEISGEESSNENVTKASDFASQKLIEIQKIISESDEISKDTNDIDTTSDKKLKIKKIRYSAENQYKLVEKLDLLSLENPEEKRLRKHAVKLIQKRVDDADKKLNDLEN